MRTGFAIGLATLVLTSCSASESLDDERVQVSSSADVDENVSDGPTGRDETSQTTLQPTSCASVEECLAAMTLDEKIGQMTQASHLALDSVDDVRDLSLGSLLAGGGGAPRSGNTPLDWAEMVDGYQEAALSSRLGIPMLFGVDAVHGHSNVFGTTIFPHNIGLGATRNPELVREIAEVTAREVYATGIRWNFAPCLCVARDERWGEPMRALENRQKSPR